MMFDNLFKGKFVLVVGGSTGIGFAVARGFQKNGATVTVTGVSDEELGEARSAGLTAVRLDVRDQAACDKVVAGMSKLDVLASFAGTIKPGSEHTPDVFADIIDVNLTGTMRICTAARPLLKASRGCIITTASMRAFTGGAAVPGYSASKGGVVQLTKALAVAYAEDGVRVNAVAPGYVRTGMTQHLWSDPQKSKPFVERTPLKRWAEVEDIVGPVLFLCSEAASFITGVVLPVDGGYLAS